MYSSDVLQYSLRIYFYLFITLRNKYYFISEVLENNYVFYVVDKTMQWLNSFIIKY